MFFFPLILLVLILLALAIAAWTDPSNLKNYAAVLAVALIAAGAFGLRWKRKK